MAAPVAHPLPQAADFYTVTVVLLPQTIWQIDAELVDYNLASNFQCLHNSMVADVGSLGWSSDSLWMPLLGLVLFLLWSSALCLCCLGYTFCNSKHILKYIFHTSCGRPASPFTLPTSK